MANQATAGPTVALGVLSSAGSAGTATTSDYVYRRTTVREGLRGFDPSVLQRVAVRFLLAGTEVTKPHSNNVKELRMAREENRTHGDMILLDMCDLCHRWRCRRPKCLPSLATALAKHRAPARRPQGGKPFHVRNEVSSLVQVLRAPLPKCAVLCAWR